MKDKELQMKILEQIMEEMGDYEFEKKLKPKMGVMKVEVEKEEEAPKSLKALLMGEGEDEEAPEGMEEDSPSMIAEHRAMKEEDEEDDELGARLKKHFAKA